MGHPLLLRVASGVSSQDGQVQPHDGQSGLSGCPRLISDGDGMLSSLPLAIGREALAFKESGCPPCRSKKWVSTMSVTRGASGPSVTKGRLIRMEPGCVMMGGDEKGNVHRSHLLGSRCALHVRAGVDRPDVFADGCPSGAAEHDADGVGSGLSDVDPWAFKPSRRTELRAECLNGRGPVSQR